MALQKISRSLLNTGVADSSDATAITIDSSENVTFAGTLTSGAVVVTGDANPALEVSRGSANTTNVNLKYNTTLTGQLSAANAKFQISAVGSSTPMEFYTNGARRLIIDSAGFFDYESTGNDIARFSGPNSGGLTIRNDTANQVIIHTATSDALVFGTGGNNDRMTIDTSGTVKMFTASGVASLILDNDNDTPYLRFDESSASKFTIGESSIVGGGDGYYDFYAVAGVGQRFFTAAGERLRIDSAGIVGIGNTVAGTIHGVSTVSNLVVGTGSGNNGIGVYSGASNLGAITFADGTSGNTTYRGGVTYNHNTDHLELNVNGGSAHVIVHSSGVTSIPYGVELGSGVDATAANTLDDYEEGTWTPVIQGLGGNNATFTAANALYTKVGRLVHVTAYIHTINLAAITSGNYIVLTGLPFAATGYGDFTMGYKTGGWADSSTAIVGGYVQSGQSYIYFVSPNGVEPSQGGNYAMTKMMLNVTYVTP